MIISVNIFIVNFESLQNNHSTMKVLQLSAILLLTVIFTNSVSAQKEVSSDKARYKVYESLFTKPKTSFPEKYKKVYMSPAVSQISKSSTKINVCVNNIIQIEDEILEGHDQIFKNTRRITEYLLATISKYTALKFYHTTTNCDLNIDFNRAVAGSEVSFTVFAVKEHRPSSEILIDHDQIKSLAYSKGVSLLKAYMRVLMKEIIHGLGVGKNEDETNLVIGGITEGGKPLLLSKREVYNLRSIYGSKTSSGNGGGSRSTTRKPRTTTRKAKTTTRKPRTTTRKAKTTRKPTTTTTSDPKGKE